MKVFVWKRIERCTGNWHPEGGLVVFAEDEKRARELAKEKDSYCLVADDEAPDEVRDVVGGGEAVYIMQDAGCC